MNARSGLSEKILQLDENIQKHKQRIEQLRVEKIKLSRKALSLL